MALLNRTRCGREDGVGVHAVSVLLAVACPAVSAIIAAAVSHACAKDIGAHDGRGYLTGAVCADNVRWVAGGPWLLWLLVLLRCIYCSCGSCASPVHVTLVGSLSSGCGNSSVTTLTYAKHVDLISALRM